MMRAEYRWAGAVIALSIVAIVLTGQLHAGRVETREVRENVVVLRAHVERLQSGAVSAAARASATSSAAIPSASAPSAPTRVRRKPRYADEIEQADPEERDRARRVALRKLYAEPEGRALFIAVAREGQRSYYAGLAEALGLSPDEEDRFMESMAENVVRRQAQSGPVDGDSDSWHDFQTEQQIQDTEMLGLLGEARFKRFKQYRETLAERAEVRSFRDSLAEGEDLTQDVADRLVEALAAHNSRVRQQRQSVSQGQQVFFGTGHVVSLDPEADNALATAREELEEQDRDRMKATQSVLDRAQGEAYAAFLAEQRETTLARTQQMLREHAGAQAE